ncbi:hypothetical protein QQZ08_005368 [Neonectria magnoliae]|uniref:Protein kinase domain-containing protein n=1 Tax=Neonectria magnoliae TaxID=2732573 RepID=A0ABR1I4H5_9HYPO
MPPLGMSLRTLQELQKDNVFQQTLVTTTLDQTLLGLNYLHDANVIHTDIHSDNLLIALTDDSILSTVEDNELHRPSARKYVDDTVIHVSQYVLGGAGALTICDLGQARIGKVHRCNAMPVPYRAPEVILGMTWGNAVDIWSVGLLAWDLLQQEGIFRIYDQSEELNDAHHLAAMTALLKPPPDIFLGRSNKTSKYWNAEGERRDASSCYNLYGGNKSWYGYSPGHAAAGIDRHDHRLRRLRNLEDFSLMSPSQGPFFRLQNNFRTYRWQSFDVENMKIGKRRTTLQLRDNDSTEIRKKRNWTPTIGGNQKAMMLKVVVQFEPAKGVPLRG